MLHVVCYNMTCFNVEILHFNSCNESSFSSTFDFRFSFDLKYCQILNSLLFNLPGLGSIPGIFLVFLYYKITNLDSVINIRF